MSVYGMCAGYALCHRIVPTSLDTPLPVLFALVFEEACVISWSVGSKIASIYYLEIIRPL